MDILTRRRFIAALAASVVAAGMPLPVGMKKSNIYFDTFWKAPMIEIEEVRYTYFATFRYVSYEEWMEAISRRRVTL